MFSSLGNILVGKYGMLSLWGRGGNPDYGFNTSRLPDKFCKYNHWYMYGMSTKTQSNQYVLKLSYWYYNGNHHGRGVQVGYMCALAGKVASPLVGRTQARQTIRHNRRNCISPPFVSCCHHPPLYAGIVRGISAKSLDKLSRYYPVTVVDHI